jgi:hypothetical protein
MTDHTGQTNAEGAQPSAPRGKPDEMTRPDVVTSVIQHQVHAGAKAPYETWLRDITPAAQRFPGHQGVNIIRPAEGDDLYTIVLHLGYLRSTGNFSRLGMRPAKFAFRDGKITF